MNDPTPNGDQSTAEAMLDRARRVAEIQERWKRDEQDRINNAEKALARALFVAYATRIEAPLSAETCAMLAKRNAAVAREEGLL